MLKRITACVVLLCLASPVVASPNPYAKPNLQDDPDVKKLIRLREKLTRQLAERGADLDQLEDAYRNGDTAAIRDLFGVTLQDEQRLNGELLEVRSNLQRKRQELATDRHANACPTTDYERSFKILRKKVAQFRHDGGGFSTFDEEEDPTQPPTPVSSCMWMPYIASLFLCTTYGIWAYFLCAYAQTCWWCDDQLTEIICD